MSCAKPSSTISKRREGQVERLEQVFALCDLKPTAKSCPAIKGILEEGEEDMKEAKDPDVLDAGMIADAQAVEHYEIARYGTMIAWAKQLGMKDAASLLEADARAGIQRRPDPDGAGRGQPQSSGGRLTSLSACDMPSNAAGAGLTVRACGFLRHKACGQSRPCLGCARFRRCTATFSRRSIWDWSPARSNGSSLRRPWPSPARRAS